MLFLRKVPIVSPTLGVGLICAQRKHQTRIRETLENDSASPMWGCGFAGTKRGFGGSGNGPGCRLAPGVSHLRIQRRSAQITEIQGNPWESRIPCYPLSKIGRFLGFLFLEQKITGTQISQGPVTVRPQTLCPCDLARSSSWVDPSQMVIS